MANKRFWLGLLITALVVGTVVIGCDTGANDTGANTGSAGSAITYTVTANGKFAEETTTKLTFTFSKPVIGLKAEDIAVRAVAGMADKGSLAGSGTSWDLEITTVTIPGTVNVTIDKTGIDNKRHPVTIHKEGVAPDITYTVTADGELAKKTTTKLTFTFSAEVNNLQAEDIEIINGTGAASKGTLTGSGTSWNLEITDIEAGTVEVKIDKAGIESGEKPVMIHKEGDTPDITYTVTANGELAVETTTQLTFTFLAEVSGLQAADITITNSTGEASKGTLTGDGTSWKLNITGVTAGTVKVKIAKAGIETGEKTVKVYKMGDNPDINYTITANGTADKVTSSQLTFTFSAAVSGLRLENIIITNGTGAAEKDGRAGNGTLTGSGTSWTLSITKVTAGTVKVKIDKDSIENGEKTVTVHKDSATGEDRSKAITLTSGLWENGSLADLEHVLWYKFEAAAGTEYRVLLKSSAFLKVTAYKEGSTTPIEDFDEVSPYEPIPLSGVSGTVYLKVELIYNSYIGFIPGPFDIRFYDPANMGPQDIIKIDEARATLNFSVVIKWSVWAEESIESIGYRVYRSDTEDGTYEKIDEIEDSSIHNCTDKNLKAGKTYWYKVAGYNSKGEGEQSEPKQSEFVADIEAAKVLTIGAGITKGNLKGLMQADWYKFTAEAGKTYTVQCESSANRPGDYTAYLINVSAFKSDKTPIDFRSDYYTDYSGTISGVSGTVYLKVWVMNDFIGTYGIKVTQ